MSRRQKDAARQDLESIEVECLLLGLYRRYGYDLRQYDPEFVRRQVDRRLREEEADSISRLSEAMLRDPAILERFLKQFAGPEEVLFETASFWGSLRRNVVPFLRTYPTVRLWLIGAKPEEVFSLSILLEEDLPRHVQIYATDIHEALLGRAREGMLPSGSIAKGLKPYRQSGGRQDLGRYFQKRNGAAVLNPELRRRVVFSSYNPVTDGTFQQCHVVLARKTLDAYSEDLRLRTYRLLHQSLVSLGFLALGPKASLESSPLRACYKEIDRVEGLFQKVRE